MNSSSGQPALSQRIAFLRTVPLLAALPERDLIILCQDFSLRDYRKGQFVFHQGDPSRELYIVLKGKVRIFRVSLAGDETSVNIFSTGDIIGECAMIDQQTRSASAQAVERCALLEMWGDRFLQHMREMPDLALEMVRLLTGKLRWTTTFAETIAQYDAAGRLLHILLLYNERFGQEQIVGKRYVLDLALNQADLATLVGVRRERINRLLQDWSRRGLIEYDDGKLIILDLPRVRQERDSRNEANLDQGEW